MDVKKELKRIKFFDIKPNLKSLNTNERNALKLCIRAARILHKICLKQVCGNKLEKYYETIEKSKNKSELKRFFEMNKGPWSSLHDDKPFLKGVGKKPKGVALYPEDLTSREWKKWLKKNPRKASEFESNVTIIKRKGGKLIAVPYSKFFKDELIESSKLLSQASKTLRKGSLSLYLKECSKALLSNNYWKSDVAWMKTNGFPFEIVFGPVEVYEDSFMGLKALFECFIGIPDIGMTNELKSFRKYVPEFNKIISKKFNYKTKGSLMPIVVFNDVFRSGDATIIGRQFTAANLPNDRKIHQLYGSKKIFSKTFMKAKSSLEIAKKIFSKKDVKHHNLNSKILSVLAHEIAHGLGPGIIKKGRKKISFEKLLGEFHSSLEEAKADALGFTFIKFLISKKILPKILIRQIVVGNLAWNFYGWRKDFRGAHNLAGLIEYNYLKKNKAIFYNKIKKTISIDEEKASATYEELAYKIMKVQQKGSYKHAKEFVKKFSKVQPEIKYLLNKLKNAPLEVFPIFKV